MTAMTIWQRWFGGSETSWAIRFFSERLSVVLLAASMMTILFLMGQSHHKVFLQWGNWRVSPQQSVFAQDRQSMIWSNKVQFRRDASLFRRST
jgi:hypothetical protein